MLVILNLPLIGIWIKLLTVPYRLLYPAILTFCCIGLYTRMEENLRRALLLSRGVWTTFLARGLSAGLLAAAALMVIIVMLPSIKKKREIAFQAEEV